MIAFPAFLSFPVLYVINSSNEIKFATLSKNISFNMYIELGFKIGLECQEISYSFLLLVYTLFFFPAGALGFFCVDVIPVYFFSLFFFCCGFLLVFI